MSRFKKPQNNYFLIFTNLATLTVYKVFLLSAVSVTYVIQYVRSLCAKLESLMKKMSKPETEFGIAPLRSLDDFFLESARFQIPNFKDLDKWGNRVIKNLLYYQTNYFLMSFIIFVIVGVIHPIKMACGFLVTAVLFMVFCYVTNEKVAAAQFKRKHPIVSIFVILAGAYFVTYMLKSLLVFMFGILLPISAIFIHSSLRLRNIKNKFVNTADTLGFNKRTPMGIFLEEIGLEGESF